MTVRFILGRSGSGKTELCLREMTEKLKQDAKGDPILYLVPEQMSFLSENRLLQTPGLGGMIRAQVYSFPRLAWRILQETGGFTRYHLTSVGVSMMIRKIIEDQKEQLKIFQQTADKNGFVQQLEQMLIEFKRYAVGPEELSMHQGNTPNQKVLNEKLHDLELIYQQFEDEMAGKYIDSEDYFRLLAEKIPQSTYLKKAEIYIDGFTSFTPLELQIIEQLMKTCKRITVSLQLDRPFKQHPPNELHLFRQTGETYRNLYELVQKLELEMEEVILKDQRKWQDESLKHLEAEFDSRPVKVYNGETNLHIIEAANRRAEVEGVARQIRELAQHQGFRYKNMAVLMRNDSDYRDMIETVFTDYDIPYFMDQNSTMLNHPLIELIRSSLETVLGNWRYEPVFRAIKTDLLFPAGIELNEAREQMDLLENYVLAYGIRGEKWTKKDRWSYRRIRGLEFSGVAQTDAEREIEELLNELRKMITAPLQRLQRRLKRADNGRKLCEAIYLYIEELDVPAKLEAWRIEAEEHGRLVEARQHDQAWNAVIDLLDQFVEMLGEEEVSKKQFMTILDAGFESLAFSLIPPAIDQVVVANLEKVRLANDMKATFVIGVNDGVLPAKLSDEGILPDEDREKLQEIGLKLANTSKIRLLDENHLAYQAFTSPTELLFVSYPIANEEGKALLPSPYIKRLAELLPQHTKHTYLAEPSDLPEAEQLHYVSGENTALRFLTAQLQLTKRHYPIYDFWWDVYNYYVETPKWRQTAKKVLASLFYENRAKSLSENVSNELYGDEIQASVSRMELFNSCAFSHFMQHGLRLRERQIFRLEAPDIGDLFHAALKHIAEVVMDENLSWASLTVSQVEQLAKEAVDMLAPRLQNEILLSSNRHHYIKRKLERIISRASMIMSEHAKTSKFQPLGLELAFGRKAKLPPLGFTLKNGAKMELMGRIDRVDMAEGENGLFLRVLDYKSSDRDLNLTEVYYGLALQMLTYLDIIITHSPLLVGKQADPAGVFYFHVHNPMIRATKMLTLDEIEEEIIKQFKMNGLLLADEHVAKLMDETMDAGVTSQVVAAGLKKDGHFTKASKVASKEEFDGLRHFVREKYVETGNKIVSGMVDIDPFKLKDRMPCTFCPFKSVCQFDQSLETNEFRTLAPIGKEAVFESIKKEEKGL